MSEAWLEGPLEEFPALLMPVAHSLAQAMRDLRAAAAGLTERELWQRPGGAASIGFHLVHIAGSADRLFTYAQGRALSEDQFAALARESTAEESGASAEDLIDHVDGALAQVLEGLKRTREDELTDVRHAGRARLPTTLIGLLFHIAEHTQRHTGQVITTARIVKGGGM